MTVRRLGGDDEGVLELLARDEADFDVEGRSEAKEPLARDDARAFLGDANVLFWVAEHDGDVVGFLSCQLVRKRAGAPELLLYERRRRRLLSRLWLCGLRRTSHVPDARRPRGVKPPLPRWRKGV
jgi:ribosomal protein S18 acetylase RimI-like enzyme